MAGDGWVFFRGLLQGCFRCFSGASWGWGWGGGGEYVLQSRTLAHTHTRNAFHVYCIAFWCSRRPVVGICTYRLSARTIVSRPRPLLGRFLWLLPGLPFRHLNANGHWTCLWISGCVFVSLLCHTNVGSLFSQCRHFIICFSSFIL